MAFPLELGIVTIQPGTPIEIHQIGGAVTHCRLVDVPCRAHTGEPLAIRVDQVQPSTISAEHVLDTTIPAIPLHGPGIHLVPWSSILAIRELP